MVSPAFVQRLLFANRLLLGGIFMYAAVPKILDPAAFAVAVYNYRLLPDETIGIVAAGLPWIELAGGCMLVAGVRCRSACLVLTVLLGAFTAAMLINTLRGIDVECGCFTADRMIGWGAVFEDALLTILGLWCLKKGGGSCGRSGAGMSGQET